MKRIVIAEGKVVHDEIHIALAKNEKHGDKKVKLILEVEDG